MDNEIEEIWLMTILLIVIMLKKRQVPPRLIRDKLCTSSLTGKMFVQELLDGSSTNVYQLFRMEKFAFVALCDYFRERGYLSASRHLDVEEKMAIFMMMISHNSNNRFNKNRFQHSGHTISKYFHEVLRAMLKFAKEMIGPPVWDTPVEEIRNYRQLREGPFKGAVGALDGTLIHAVVPPEKQTPFRGRGGKDCFQNVMAICDFDMRFVYVVAGWEGVAHDSRVLNESIQNEAFKFPMPPQGKYYLCDAAYSHTRGFMAPYRGKRYWLKEYQNGGRARDKEEKFNHAHSQLRNVIERAFGVLKARFQILENMPSFSFVTQRRVVIACMAMHNFLRQVALDDVLFTKFSTPDMIVDNRMPMDSEESSADNDLGDQEYMVAYRNRIADELDQMIRN